MSTLKILWLEDSEMDQKSFQRLISKINDFTHEITWASSLGEGLDLLEKNKFDVVITDLGLPDCNGLNILEKCRPHIEVCPFIIASQHDDDLLLKSVSKYQVFDYLVKSDLSPSGFRRSIRYAISRFEVENEKKILSKQLKKSQQMEIMGNLASGIAHDFNNKLAIIQGNVDVLLNDKPDQNIHSRLKEVKETIVRSKNLIKELLTFGSTKNIQQENKTVLNVQDSIINSLNLLSPLINSGIKIKSDFSKRPLCIHMDSTHMDQIVMNLLLNAQDAMTDNKGKIHITTEIATPPQNVLPIAQTKEYVKIKITDNGPGMSEEILGKVIEPFFSTKSKDNGTGMGLAIVDSIISQYQGFLEIKSKLKKGCTFEIYLPRSEEEPSEIANNHEGGSVANGEMILLVEDEKKLIDPIRHLLECRGFKVIPCSNGQDAIDIFKKRKDEISGILTDVFMGKGMTGIQLLEKIRKIDQHIGIVLVSGESQDKLNIANDPTLSYRTFFHLKPYNVDLISKSLLRLIHTTPSMTKKTA